MSRSSVPLTKEERIAANKAFKDETENLFRILKNAFEKVVDTSGNINLIIAVNQRPSWGSFRVPKRVAYYITKRTRYGYRNEVISNNLDVKAYVHDIYTNKDKKIQKEKDLIQKYKVMVDWRPYTANAESEIKGRVVSLMGTGPGKITTSGVKDEQMNSLMNFFIYDEKILTNIDSITTIDRDTHFAKFIYDKDIRAAPKFERLVKKGILWARKRQEAEAAGHPSVFFEQPEEQELLREMITEIAGRPSVFFEQPEQKELLRQMRANPQDTLNLFGKKTKPRKVVNSRNEISKINKMIAAIDKLIR